MAHSVTRHWTTRRHLIVAAALIVVAAWFAGQLNAAVHSVAPAGDLRRITTVAPGGDIPIAVTPGPDAGDVEPAGSASPDPTDPLPAPGTSALAALTTPAVPPSAPATAMSVEAVPAGTVAADIPVPVVPTSSQAPTGEMLGVFDALAVLAWIPVALEHRDGYNRDLFAVWIDVDGDGCDTRDEVLADENLTPVGGGCPATTGTWLSVYDNATWHDPGALDVDHLVSLKETFDSGAWAWSAERRISYGNDLTDERTLVAVSAASNRAKGDRDPSNWIPDAGLCDYLADWIAIKARWALSMDESEHGRLGNLLQRDCPGLTIDPWPPAP